MKRAGWIVAVVLGLVAYGLGRHGATVSAELANWRLAAQQAVQAGAAYRQSRDSLQQVQGVLQAQFVALRAAQAHQALRVDTLVMAAETAQTVGPIRAALEASQSAWAICQEALSVADTLTTTCQRRAVLSEVRADSLEGLLRRGVRIQSCRVLFFPCPSRGVVFVGTAIGTYLLTRR
jgi:hypothetical protein